MNTKKAKHIGIIGKGMIGMSLAVLFTGNQYKVTILDRDTTTGVEKYDDFYNDLIKQDLVSVEQAKKCKELLNITTDYTDLAEVDMVFESVPEVIEIKFDVYKQIEANCKNCKAIVSTTSALPLARLIEGVQDKSRLMVAHPFNPPHLVPFVEMVRGELTSDESVALAKNTLEDTGRKVVVLNKDELGFIANRLQHALIREALYIVEQGIASPEDVDKTLQYSFMPRYTSIGIFEHQDHAGLDLIDNVSKDLYPDLCDAKTTLNYVKERVEAGNLGRKTGKGVYDWSQKDLADFLHRSQAPYYQFFNWNLPEV